MSQSEIDKIISKYDKKPYLPRKDLQYTERKKQAKQPHMVTFMDHSYTPTKEVRELKLGGSAITEAYASAEQLLRQLDDTQKKFVVSERNYADACRKYDKLKQAYDMQQVELQKQRKLRLQQLIDVQNKLHLLQTDNDKNLTKLQSKDHTIAILKEKLSQKQQQIIIFEQQLQQISRKLYGNMELREKQSAKIIHKQISLNNQQASRSLQVIKQKYEKHINILNAEIDKFNIDLLAKQKQKRQLLNQMEQMGKKQMIQIRQIKDALLKNQEQYKNWLDEAKKQKLDIVDKYEQQIRQFRKDQYATKLNKSDNALEDTKRGKILIRQLESKNIQLQNQVKNNKSQIQTLTRADKQNYIKLSNMQQQLKHMKIEYLHQISENKKLLANLKIQQQKYENIRIKNNKNQIQMEAVRRKSEQILAENERLEKEVQNLRSDMGKQLKSLINVKKQLNQATDNQLNMNSILTTATVKLKAKIQHLQQQLQHVTTQLYAERLQKAKIIQQLQQTKIQMKMEYELSIENTKKQLQQQIKQNFKGKTQQYYDKQQLYLNMFKLERQYEKLKCEVITSDQMLKMGNKMAKYYQKKTK